MRVDPLLLRLTDDAALDDRHLSRAECHAWIFGHDEARLGFDTGRGHRSVVVTYAARADEVLLLLPEYHPAAGYVLGSRVTLDVEATRTDGRWETVRASGVAYEGDDLEGGAGRPGHGSWPPGVVTHTVHVPFASVEGVVRAA